MLLIKKWVLKWSLLTCCIIFDNALFGWSFLWFCIDSKFFVIILYWSIDENLKSVCAVKKKKKKKTIEFINEIVECMRVLLHK